MASNGTRRRSTSNGEHKFPAWVVEVWQTTRLRVELPQTAKLLWERVLSASEKERLGSDLNAAYARYDGAAGMWKHLNGVSVPQAVVSVAVRCQLLDPNTGQALLREFNEVPSDPEDAVAHAVASGGLVLVELPRRVAWEGETIPVNWARRNRLWALLNELARQSKVGAVVDRVSLDDDGITDPDYVTKALSRLTKLQGFPQSLTAAIQSVGRGTYQLSLPRDRIRIFVRGVGEILQEWTRA